MTQINILEDMYYTIRGHSIELDIIERYGKRPDLCIAKEISTSNTHFWDFVFDAVIEAKQEWIDADQDDEWDGKPESIEWANKMVEVYRNHEKALEPLVSHSRLEARL